MCGSAYVSRGRIPMPRLRIVGGCWALMQLGKVDFACPIWQRLITRPIRLAGGPHGQGVLTQLSSSHEYLCSGQIARCILVS